MRKQSKLAMAAVLTLTAVACIYLMFANRGQVDLPVVDRRLVGTWLSSDYHGYRLILMDSGTFVVTRYGWPGYGAETWSAQNGNMHLILFGDHGERGERDVTYSLSPDGQRLTISHDVFGVNAKEYVRATNKP
jgi:hypothetical protein